jgi:hypothetical protein
MIKNDLLVGHFIHAALHWLTFYYNNCVGENRPITQPVDPVRISGILQKLMILMRIACSGCSDSIAATYLLRPKWEDILFAIDVMVTTTQHSSGQSLLDLHMT